MFCGRVSNRLWIGSHVTISKPERVLYKYIYKHIAQWRILSFFAIFILFRSKKLHFFFLELLIFQIEFDIFGDSVWLSCTIQVGFVCKLNKENMFVFSVLSYHRLPAACTDWYPGSLCACVSIIYNLRGQNRCQGRLLAAGGVARWGGCTLRHPGTHTYADTHTHTCRHTLSPSQTHTHTQKHTHSRGDGAVLYVGKQE